MGGISIKSRLEIDNKKLKAKEQHKADLTAELSTLEAEIKMLKARIEYNTKKWNRLYPNELWSEEKGKK